MTTKKQSIPVSVIVAAIAALAVIEVFAMIYGINGGVRTLIVGIIAALAGFALPSPLRK